VEGGYRLTGRWSFASGIRHATWLGCQECPVVDEAGQPKLDAAGKRRQCILFFRPSDARIEDVWQVSGLRGTGSDSYSVQDLFVPLEYAACDRSFDTGPLYVFSSTNIFAAGFASVALGIARACLDAFRSLAVTKAPRGIAGVLREQPTVQVLYAQSEAIVGSARALLHETIAFAWDEASRERRLSLDTRVRLRLATTFAINQAADVVDHTYHAAGATAIFASEPFKRRFRDMHAVTQHLQAREDHYISVGRHLFGLEPDLHWV
jgi:alkylation response protein AidB-like acyl-CoA dehydrogenase